MESIKRKSLLYKTGVEYGDYTINHALGCSHGCKYPCYAFLMAKRFGRVKSYEEWIQPKIAINALEILEKEIPKFKDDIKEVHLCFTTDPFMLGYDEVSEMSIEIIKKLNETGIKCTTLTKGILPNELAELNTVNEFGITLVSLDESYREEYEPYASPYIDRIESLKYLHDKGVKTWVSIEPYPTPNIIEQNYDDILDSISFVDKIIFGRTNYNKIISEYKNQKQFYNELAYKTIDYCTKNNIDYHIKEKTITENMPIKNSLSA
ncbi:MAG: radical SAM protein [Clostridia bacterium]|jgi:DNA repair photolyase|nr:radical SAM protein [Clostridia bacterium]